MDNKRETSSVVDELNRLDGQIDAAPDLNALKPIFYRLEEITKDNSADLDVQKRVSGIKQHLMSRGRELKPEGGVTTGSNPMLASHATGSLGIAMSATGAPPVPSIPTSSYPAQIDDTLPLPNPGRTAPEESIGSRTESMREVYVPPVRTPPPPPPPPPPAGPPANWRKPALIGGFLGLFVVAAIVGVMAYVKRKPAAPPIAPPASTVAVSVGTIPAGAEIRVNDQSTCKSNCRIDLKPGQYNLMAVLPGYEQALQSVTVEAGHPVTLSLTLIPQAPTLKILTDLGNGGQVVLDGKPMGPLQDGQAVFDRLAAGTHDVKITSDKGAEAKFSFLASPGSAPTLQGSIATKNLAAVLASGLGSQIHIGTSVMPMKVSLDGKPAGDAGANGIDLNDIAAGDHELTLNDGKDDRKLTVTASPAPVLTAWINASTSGVLVVNAGEDNATVLVDGKAYPHKTKRGQLWIYNLAPKDYKIKVVKQGFQDSQEQTASVKKGEEARVAFKLQAIPQIAVLHITGATPGADVLIDNQSAGKIDASGALSYPNVAPGDHTVEIRREQYIPKTLSKTFRPGETLELSGDAVVLERATGTLRLTLTPKEAQVLIRRSDESRGNPIVAGSHSLPAGNYVLVGKAPGYTDATVSVQVKPGDLAVAEVKLVKEGGTVKAAIAKPDWEHPAEWQAGNGWLVHSGGNFVPFNVQPSTGVFIFSARLLKGGVFTKHIQWRVNNVDDKNYVHFQLDKKTLQSRIVSNGKSVERPKVQIEGQEPFTLQIEISADRIVHKMREGDQWVVIDTLPQANANQGKFGFFIPGKDEVAISGFSFSPR
ncbi:MAG: PEGA domain-containing protein [Bryobacteraceae bacterium]